MYLTNIFTLFLIVFNYFLNLNSKIFTFQMLFYVSQICISIEQLINT